MTARQDRQCRRVSRSGADINRIRSVEQERKDFTRQLRKNRGGR